MLSRTAYLDFLSQNKDREQVKILSGLRGCGKTELLFSFIRKLLDEGVSEERVLYLDFSSPDAARVPWAEHARAIRARYMAGGRAYIFLDEIEELPGFERLVDQLFRVRDFDLYLAGSGLSARLEPLTKLLPGRCLVREVFPLSFAETLAGKAPTAERLLDYTARPAMPACTDGRGLDTAISAALFRDVLCRADLRPKLLLKILGMLSRECGELLPLEKIGEETGRAGRPLLLKTIRAYTDALEAAGLLLALPFLPIADAGSFLTVKKHTYRFFFPDPAMLSLFGKPENLPYRRLFTAIAAELARRGLSPATGKTAHGTVDFVATGGVLETLYQFIPDPGAPDAEEKWETLVAAPERCRKCVLTFYPEKFPEKPEVAVRALERWFAQG